MSIIDSMQASSKYSFYRDMRSISTTNKNGKLVGGFLLGVTSVVYFRTAYGDCGTPSVMAKAIRAPKSKWCNDVVIDKMSIIDCMQASSKYSFYRDMRSISTTNKNGELVGGFLLGVTSGE